MLEPTGLSAKSLYLETKVKGKDLYIALRGVEHEKGEHDEYGFEI